jgi:hypothetical protein
MTAQLRRTCCHAPQTVEMAVLAMDLNTEQLLLLQLTGLVNRAGGATSLLCLRHRTMLPFVGTSGLCVIRTSKVGLVVALRIHTLISLMGYVRQFH